MAVEGMTESLAGLDMATTNSSNDKTADYKKLIEYGLDAKVADKLDEIYKVEMTKILIQIIIPTLVTHSILRILCILQIA